jgi:hypothetical protein
VASGQPSFRGVHATLATLRSIVLSLSALAESPYRSTSTLEVVTFLPNSKHSPQLSVLTHTANHSTLVMTALHNPTVSCWVQTWPLHMTPHIIQTHEFNYERQSYHATGRRGPYVFSVRYEHHLYIQNKAVLVTGRGGS